jgi:muconolactone delta-isomerase
MFESSLGRLMGVLGIVVLSLAGLMYWGTRPSEGDLEFKQAQAEMRKATSWRYKRVWRDIGHMATETVEVSCPSSQHIVRQHASVYGDSYPSVTAEYIQIGHDQYFKPGPNQPWTRPAEPIAEIADVAPVCDRVARGEDTSPFPAYTLWRKQGLYQKGGRKSLQDGVECQDWIAKVPVQNPRPDEIAEVCLGVVDHLPYHHTWSNGEFEYSDWNAPFTIQAPDFVVAAPPVTQPY